MLSKAVARFERERARYPAEQFVDVDYREFVADPVGDDEGHLRRRSASSGRRCRRGGHRSSTRESRQGGRRPQHTYDLADYGLTEDEVRAAFG